MDILTHTLSGMAVATCTAAFVPQVREKIALLAIGCIGGAFPDLDAISLWSRFDGTLGKIFSLPAKGSVIYSSKFWYSHHAFLHSLLGSLLFGSILILILYLCKKNRGDFLTFIKSKKVYFVTFVLAYWAHLAGDLPTPSSAWGGIGLFWPSLDYVGGYGKIWWWNNYDIFLLIAFCVMVNLILLSLSRFLKSRVKIYTFAAFAICFTLIVLQVNTRHYDYAYSKDSTRYGEMEQNSKKEQQRILGDQVYQMMVSFDKKLKFYF